MNLARFTIDFLDGYIFEGYTKGDDWNGFACPYFMFEQSQRLVEAWKEVGSDASYDSARDEFTFQMSDAEQSCFGPVDIEGLKLYPIGNGCWIWEQVVTTIR